MSSMSKKSTNKANDAGAINGKNTVKAVTPAATLSAGSASTSEPEIKDVGLVTTGKPDQAAFNAEQSKIKVEIDAVQVRLNAVKEKISSRGKDVNSNDKRTQLRAELESIRAKQASTKTNRTKLQEQLNLSKDNLQKKIQTLQAAKTKFPHKSVAEVDAQVQLLEKRVESGTLKLGDEKRALQEIGTLKRSRRTIESFKADQDAIDAERARVDELRNQLDDPESKAMSQRYDSIRTELDELKKDNDSVMADRNKLFDERNALSAELDALYTRKRESAQKYREASDRFYAKLAEDRARRAERIKAQRAAEEDAKRKGEAERLLEEARSPAFQDKIEDCQNLIDYFNAKVNGGSTHIPHSVILSGSKSNSSTLPQLDLRQVEHVGDGLIARKKKGDGEESYFVGGKGKGKKGGNKTGSSTPTPAANAALNIPFPTLTALLEFSIPPPASYSDLPRTVEDLKTKKAWFEANQDRVTTENVAKAEAKIKRLTNGKDNANSNTEQSSEAPTPAIDEEHPIANGEAVHDDHQPAEEIQAV